MTFLLFTDGSGHLDGFGGWACLLQVPELKLEQTRFGGVKGTSTERMEMHAMLAGLQLCMDVAHDHQVLRPEVHWRSDRESMVKIALGAYKPSASLDLWHAYRYYEQHLTILPAHVKIENEGVEFKLCDMHASTLREVIKKYTLSTNG